MDFEYSTKTKDYLGRLKEFMDQYVYPNEAKVKQQIDDGDRWTPIPIIEELKPIAKEAGLWNLFLPDSERGAGFTNLEYAPLSEMMGRVDFSSEIFNCSAPDTGNMETLERYASDEIKQKYLVPLLNGEIRSCFAMTEPRVASSDATNIESSIVRDGDEYVLNGIKWFTSGALHPNCRIAIFMGKTDFNAPKHMQQSMIVVPMDTPGVEVKRHITVFGYDDAPHGHGETHWNNVRVPVDHLLLGEGRGFEIAQGRLGPGRIHHCMRTIGMAERALELMKARSKERVAFGTPMAEKGMVRDAIAKSRMEIEQSRLLVLKAAHLMDTVGNRTARKEIAMIKVVVPNMAYRVLDRALQVHGGVGVSQDTPIARMFCRSRSLRIADGPDEVHTETVAKLELRDDDRCHLPK